MWGGGGGSQALLLPKVLLRPTPYPSSGCRDAPWGRGPRHIKPPPPPCPRPPHQARTALRSGACGLEGLTGTESPAAEGM